MNEAQRWETAQDSFLLSFGYRRKCTVHDSSSLFRVVAELNFGNQILHEMMRRDAVKYIHSNRSLFGMELIWLDDGYLNTMSMSATHGTLVELKALALLYQANVFLFESFTIGKLFLRNNASDKVWNVFMGRDNHFDIVYPVNHMQEQAQSQSFHCPSSGPAEEGHRALLPSVHSARRNPYPSLMDSNISCARQALDSNIYQNLEYDAWKGMAKPTLTTPSAETWVTTQVTSEGGHPFGATPLQCPMSFIPVGEIASGVNHQHTRYESPRIVLPNTASWNVPLPPKQYGGLNVGNITVPNQIQPMYGNITVPNQIQPMYGNITVPNQIQPMYGNIILPNQIQQMNGNIILPNQIQQMNGNITVPYQTPQMYGNSSGQPSSVLMPGCTLQPFAGGAPQNLVPPGCNPQPQDVPSAMLPIIDRNLLLMSESAEALIKQLGLGL